MVAAIAIVVVVAVVVAIAVIVGLFLLSFWIGWLLLIEVTKLLFEFSISILVFL